MLISRENKEFRLIIQEELTQPHALYLREQMLQAMTEVKSGVVVLDITQVEMMDATGLRLLLGLYKTTLENGLLFRVEIITPALIKQMDAVGLRNFIDIREVTANG